MAPPISVTYKGENVLLNTLAQNKGVVPATLLARWRAVGRPQVVSDDLLSPARSCRRHGYTIDGVYYQNSALAAAAVGCDPSWVRKKFDIMRVKSCTKKDLLGKPREEAFTTVIFEGANYTFNKLADHLEATVGKSQNFYRNRWLRAGMPEEVTLELFAEKRPRIIGTSSIPVVSMSEKQDSIYANPNYLPGIPWGDLCHLNNTRNTGEGRDSSTEPVTIDSIKRLASAVIKGAFNQYLKETPKGKSKAARIEAANIERLRHESERFLFSRNEMRKFWFENLGIPEGIFHKAHVDKNGPEILRRLACESYEGLQHNS